MEQEYSLDVCDKFIDELYYLAVLNSFWPQIIERIFNNAGDEHEAAHKIMKISREKSAILKSYSGKYFLVVRHDEYGSGWKKFPSVFVDCKMNPMGGIIAKFRKVCNGEEIEIKLI